MPSRLEALKLEQEFTANQAAPTAGLTTDGHVFPVVPVGSDREVVRFWQIKARFTATAGDSAATIILHAFDADAAQWFPSAEMTLQAVPDTTVGSILTLEGVLGSTHAAFEVGGLGDGDEIKLTLRQVN